MPKSPQKSGMSDYEYHRRRRMREMLVAARAKLDGLIREAKRYEMTDLLTYQELTQKE